MDMRALLEPKKSTKPAKSHKSDGKREVVEKPNNHGQPSSLSTSSPTRPQNMSASSSVNTSPTAIRAFDARALLNPRGHKGGVKLTRTNDRNGDYAEQRNHHNEKTTASLENGAKSGFGLLEQIHGTEKRVAQRPAKKQKTQHTTEEDDQRPERPKGSNRHGNAGVGDYFKPATDKGDTSTSVPSLAIDLTNDDDDDDDDDGLEITEVRSLYDQEVCYGMIDGVIQAYKVPKPAQSNAFNSAHNQWPVFKVDLSRNTERGMTIECIDPHGEKFGNIEEGLAQALAPAMDGFQKLRVQCRMMTRSKKQNEWAHQECSERYRVLLNLYGRKADVEKVGRWFGQKNIWFKAPMVSDSGIPIINPHSHKQAQARQKPLIPKQVVSTTRTAEEAADAVSKLFDYQAQQGNELEETDPPPSIVTPLLSHQKQALTFMLKQEKPRTFASEEAGNSSLWRKKHNHRGHVVFEEVVTGIQVSEEPAQSLGGLLADVMGLGKTIQALSLVASTASDAELFSRQKVTQAAEGETTIQCNSRATLIVAPVSTVKNWEDQIREHTRPGAMMYHVYHGSNRIREVLSLSDNDVVITTYSTAAYELFGKNAHGAGNSPLRQIRWYRIILDEAHTIREPKSSQARAMCSLHSQRRWCLTGTPIQNRMEDLGSLTTFLRLYPYDNLTRFKQYVQGPAQSGDPEFLKRLRVFVDSFTLRRLRDRIHLPEKSDLTISLEFSDPERRLHDFFREKFSVAVKEMGRENGRKGTGAQYHRVLKGITILRLICDHGKELLKEEQLNEYKGSQPEEAIDVDAEQPPTEMTKRQAYDHFNLMAEADADFCVRCSRKLTDDSPDTPANDAIDGSTDVAQAVVLPCLDTLCVDCFELYRVNVEAAQAANQSLTCDLCFSRIKPQYFRIPRGYAEELQMVSENSTSERSLFKNGFYSGPHTKTKALLSDISAMHEESRALEAQGEPPLKCVVFSEFTSHLDLLQKALSDAGYGKAFVRIDGSMTLANRRKVLDALNTNTETTILLASIKAAGQGLNLTTASRAFIMEPMWNPAAESQAVDRIYRIGQKREVIVRRYRIMSSIEDKIVQLQERKKKLAEMSMEKAAMQRALNKKERNEQSLQAMLDIFKS